MGNKKKMFSGKKKRVRVRQGKYLVMKLRKARNVGQMLQENDVVSFEENDNKKITVEIPPISEITSSNVSNANSMDSLAGNSLLRNLLLQSTVVKTECANDDFPEVPLTSIANFGQVIKISKNSCRLCLKELTDSQTYIWDYENNYEESISSLCGIVVSRYDFLTSLCKHCVEKLNDFVKFRTECIENNKKIEKLQESKHISLEPHEDGRDPTADEKCNGLYDNVSDAVIISKEVDAKRKQYSFAVEPKDIDGEIDSEQQIVFKSSEDYYSALQDKKFTFEGTAIILECEKCPVSCEGQKDIDEHIDSHRGILPLIYDCSVESCQRKFSCYNILMMHSKITHSIDIPPTSKKKLCQYCGKFVHGLNHIHQEEGIKIKIYKVNKSYSECPNCGKMVKDILKHSRKTHNEDVRRSCNVCGKIFADFYNLRSHMRTHTGEKPFSCPDCTEVFRHNVTMKFHRLKVHNVNMFKRPPEEVLASVSKKSKGERRKKKGQSAKSTNEEQ